MILKIHIPILLLLCLITFEVNAANDAWIQRANFGAEGRHRGAGFSIGNKGYIGLGHYNGAGPNIVLKDWWEYDPGTNSWTQKADYIGNNGNGNYGVSSHSTSTKGYIAGGQLSGSGLHEFDPITNSWTSKSTLPMNTSNIQGFSIGENLYIISGTSLFEYNTTSDVWTAKNDLPFGVSVWNASFTIDNKGYIKTGNSLWEYKPVTDQWSPRAPYPGLSTSGSIAFTQYGLGFIVAGYQGGLSQVNSEVWEYNPGTNSWTPRTEFYGTSRRFAVGFSIGNRCYLGTGTNGTNFNDFWEFNSLLGNEELSKTYSIVTYPNPAVDQITLKSDKNIEGKIEVVSSTGKTVREVITNNFNTTIELSNLSSGIYYYHLIKDEQIVFADKFILK